MPDASASVARQTHKRCPDCRRVLPAEAFYRRADGYLSACCKADKRRRDRAARQRSRPTARSRRAPAQGADNHRLPAGPLLVAVRPYAQRRHLSLRELLGPELFGAFGNALQAGTVRLIVLERFCDEVLGWHPRMLYGDAYDHAAHATNHTRSRQRAR
jgi:hypothetical protein